MKINKGSTDEFVECNNEVLMCVDELDKEWKESYVMGMKQRVNFLRGVMGGEERSSCIYCVDKCATNNCFSSFFLFLEKSGKI